MIDYHPKKIEYPTYEKGSQIELNQVKLQRRNDSRAGTSLPSKPNMKKRGYRVGSSTPRHVTAIGISCVLPSFVEAIA